MTRPNPIRHLSLADVIALHTEVMLRTGNQPAPLRSEGLLDSALQRPQAAEYYENADLIRQAAILAVSISQAQAFLDGNKRTAFAALDVFLRLNGFAYSGDAVQLAQQLEAIAVRTDSLEDATRRFEDWLRTRVSP